MPPFTQPRISPTFFVVTFKEAEKPSYGPRTLRIGPSPDQELGSAGRYDCVEGSVFRVPNGWAFTVHTITSSPDATPGVQHGFSFLSTDVICGTTDFPQTPLPTSGGALLPGGTSFQIVLETDAPHPVMFRAIYFAEIRSAVRIDYR